MKKQKNKSPSIKENYLGVISQNLTIWHDTTQEYKRVFLGVIEGIPLYYMSCENQPKNPFASNIREVNADKLKNKFATLTLCKKGLINRGYY